MTEKLPSGLDLRVEEVHAEAQRGMYLPSQPNSAAQQFCKLPAKSGLPFSQTEICTLPQRLRRTVTVYEPLIKLGSVQREQTPDT